MSLRSRWLVMCLTALASCRFDAAVPASQTITCSEEHPDCPSGRVCRTTLGLCVDPSDSTPPQMVSLTVSRTVLKRGDSLDVSLEVSEPLAALPSIVLQQNGRGDIAVVTSLDATHFTARSVVSDDDVMGPAQVLVSMLDTHGNAAKDLLGPQVAYDFTGPLVIQQSTLVAVQPAAGSAVTRVDALSANGAVVVTIGFDELTATVSLFSKTLELQCVELDKTGTTSTFVCKLRPGAADGVHELSVTATDGVGNVQTSTIDKKLSVDTRAPQAPRVTDENLIWLERVPWGDLDGGPRIGVSAAPGSLEPHTLTLIREGTLELGREYSTDAGGLEFTLAASDRRRVTLISIDSAGNQSAESEIKNVQLTASLRDKVVGDPLSNPNLEEQRTTFQQVFTQDDAIEMVGPISVSGEAIWENVQAVPYNVNLEPQLLYDSSRNRLVQLNSETNTWDGRRWVRAGAGLPALVSSASFDPVRGKGVAFGGVVNLATQDNLFEWNGREWAKINSPNKPPSRFGASTLYDPTLDVTIMSGGNDFTNQTCDLWTWDGHDWTQVSDHAPFCASFASSTYDTKRHRALFWGGTTINGGELRELWQYDGTWQLLVADAGVGGGSIVYEAPSDRLLLFTHSSMFALDGGDWQLLSRDDAGPDTSEHRVLPGAPGTYLSVDSTQVWTWADGGWSAQAQSTELPAVNSAPIAYVPETHETLLWGGIDSTNALHNELWSWSGTTWRKVPTANTPTARTDYIFGVDPRTSQPMLFGGQVGSTVTNELWALVDGGWRSLPSNVAARTNAAGAFSPDGLYVFGGNRVDGGITNELLKWDGTWHQIDAGAGPQPTHSMAVAWHEGRHSLEVFGGSLASYNVPFGLWEFNGNTWAQFDAPTPRRQGHRLCFDGRRNELVLYGGNVFFDLPAGITRWDGQMWARDTGTPLEGSTLRTLAFDTQRQALMVYGPQYSSTPITFYEYLIPTTERPAAVVKFALGSIDATATLSSVSVEALTGASSFRGSSSLQGAELISIGHQTQVLASNTAASTNPTTLRWSGPPPQTVGRYLAFAVAPRGTNSPSTPASVTLDRAVLRVRYRLP